MDDNISTNAGEESRNAIQLDDLYDMLKVVDGLRNDVFGLSTKNILTAIEQGYDFSKPMPGLLEEQRQSLNSLTRVLADFHQSVRKAINICSRPSLRPLGLLDLPDEILLNICGYLRLWKCSEDSILEPLTPPEATSVKNLRLTCRKLNHTSSHLLITSLCVDPSDPTSISHLDRVSGHPLIRKGVWRIRVLLYHYDGFLANSFSGFTSYQIRIFSESKNYMRSVAENTEEYCVSILRMSREEVSEKLKKADAIQQAWNRLPSSNDQISSGPTELGYQAILHRAYREYKNRFIEQEKQRKNGSFVDHVAAAAGRMPMVRRLEFHDEDQFDWDRGKPYFFKQLEDEEAMFTRMTFPMRWEESREHGWGQPPLEILFNLPIAMHKAGINLTSLEIDVSPPADYGPLAPPPNRSADLTAAMQHLRKFKFWIRGREASIWPLREKDEVEALGRFLSAVLNITRVRYISLDLGSLWDENRPPVFSLASVVPLQTCNWPNLFILSWIGVPAHHSELTQLLRRKSPFTIVHLQRLHVLSGTWENVLDLLRETSQGHTSIQDPPGGECDILSNEKIREIFESEVGLKSLADKYISKQSHRNPLRHDEMEDGE